MRIAITGHRGQLGRALQQILQGETLLGVDLPESDITDPSYIIPTLMEFRPDVVIHTAAWTDVDGAEKNPDGAFRSNAWGTQNIALACQRTSAAMVYISTNEVFDGRQSVPYREYDRPNPSGVYARSKWAGEELTRSLLQRWYIVRASWIYHRGGNNFVTTILASADRLGSLRVVADEVATPTYAPDLAAAIARLIPTEHFGLYHFPNAGSSSRYDYARRVLALAGRGHVPVEPITLADWPRPVPPPPYSVLVNTCGALLGITLRPWEEALAAYFADA
ncbi:MAG: dTDP-4-dehydrorhamnose reductase [Anaerolineae bacterium]|nr:dTDP-4-dehydrorhamnose reductase [Anaerolineae bacterium]